MSDVITCYQCEHCVSLTFIMETLRCSQYLSKKTGEYAEIYRPYNASQCPKFSPSHPLKGHPCLTVDQDIDSGDPDESDQGC